MPFLPGVKKLRISTLILPGGFGKRLPTESTDRLAESINHVGLINFPVVDPKRRLLAGHDRVFALRELGQLWVTVRVFDGTPAELAAVQFAENHHRRPFLPDDETWRKMYGKDWTPPADLPTAEPPPDPVTTAPNKGGRPVTPKGAKRRAIAEELGVPVKAVERKERKLEAQEEAAPAPVRTAEEVPSLPADFPTFGFLPEQEVIAGVLDALWEHEKAWHARKSMEAAHRALAKLAKAPPPVFLDHETLDALKPVQLCRWCEASPHRSTCDVCQGRGWLSLVDDLTAPPKRGETDADLPF